MSGFNWVADWMILHTHIMPLIALAAAVTAIPRKTPARKRIFTGRGRNRHTPALAQKNRPRKPAPRTNQTRKKRLPERSAAMENP